MESEAQYNEGQGASQTDNRAAGNVNDNRFTVNLSGLTLVITVMLMLVIGACGVVIGMDLAERRTNNDRLAKAEQEARMLQYYVNELDGKLIHAGFIEPRDRWSPEKRKQYEERKP